MRFSYYDKLKGAAIILVVIGHAIQNAYPDSFDSVELFRIIYSFHMPLFMFISGMVSFKPDGKYDLDWLKRRAVSLVIPFLVWIIIPIMFTHGWNDFFNTLKNVALSPDYSNWFLWVLLLNCLLLFFIYRVYELPLAGIIPCSFELITLFAFLGVNLVYRKFCYLGISLLKWHCLFFLMGHIIAKHKNAIYKYRYFIGVISLVVWVLIVPYWSRVDYPSFIGVFHGISGRVLDCSVLVYKYLVGFTGTAMFLFLVYIIRNLKCTNALETLGRRTIEVYLLQWYFFIFSFEHNKGLEIVLNILAGILLSYIVSEVFERNTERLFLFGKRPSI